ncbi:MAG: DegT/DnrJ/EryC1/StrS family aminotransferase [Chromatiaceae bacterium]
MTDIIPQVDPLAGYLERREAIDYAVGGALGSGRYILGERVDAFEWTFAARFGGGECVSVANGTDAVELALRGLGVGPGDLVFAPSHTSVATVAAIGRCGAAPALVDCDPIHAVIDPQSLAAALVAAQDGRAGRPAAVVAVHLYGHPAPMPELLALASAHGLPVIEDCAQAHGALLHGRPVGTWGAAGAFSFYPTKNLGAFGDGGAVLTADPAMAGRIRALRQYGWDDTRNSRIPGLNSRLDELQAAILLVRLAGFDEDQARRHAIADRYTLGLGQLVDIPQIATGAVHAWHQYVIQSDDREGLRRHLATLGVQTAIHYPLPVHLQDAYRDRIALAPGGLPNTEALCRRILSLPLFPQLRPDQVDRVIEGITRWSGIAV